MICTQNDSAVRLDASRPVPTLSLIDRIANLPVQNDLSLSLLEVLSLAECPLTGFSQEMGKTPLEREEFRALSNLWQSLGRPTSVFWRETDVFVNRVLA